jgi:hypothetical protein
MDYMRMANSSTVYVGICNNDLQVNDLLGNDLQVNKIQVNKTIDP